MNRHTQKNKNSWFTKSLLIINLFLILPLIAAYFSPGTHPETSVIPALAAIFYPAFLVINILFVVFWLLKLRIYFLFSLLAIAGGYNFIFKTIAFNSDKPVGNYEDAIKLLSYNVRLFDQYKWTGGQNYFTRNSVFEFINSQQADVICFQEFFHGTEKSFPTVGPFVERSKTKNFHVDYVLVKGNGTKHFGLATFTRFPIVGKGKIRFEGARANSGIYTDILFQSDTIRIFNFHLESVKLSRSDHKYVADFIDPGAATPASNSKVIIGKISKATKTRAKQAEIVSRYINASPYPVIVCGDFNDTPLSYVYHKVSSGLDDAFLEIGNGVGQTYAGGIPFLRIDYILHSYALEPFRFEKHDVTYSDHFPISCYFKLKK